MRFKVSNMKTAVEQNWQLYIITTFQFILICLHWMITFICSSFKLEKIFCSKAKAKNSFCKNKGDTSTTEYEWIYASDKKNEIKIESNFFPFLLNYCIENSPLSLSPSSSSSLPPSLPLPSSCCCCYQSASLEWQM